MLITTNPSPKEIRKIRRIAAPAIEEPCRGFEQDVARALESLRPHPAKYYQDTEEYEKYVKDVAAECVAVSTKYRYWYAARKLDVAFICDHSSWFVKDLALHQFHRLSHLDPAGEHSSFIRDSLLFWHEWYWSKESSRYHHLMDFVRAVVEHTVDTPINLPK